MKYALLSLATVLCMAVHSQAQGLHLGIKGGANITQVEGKAMSDEFKYGYHLGGFAEIGLGKKAFIQPEVLWSQYAMQTGHNFNDIIINAKPGTDNQNITLNYLQIPITANYRLLEWLSIQAGPQFSVLLDNHKTLLENGKDAFSSGDFSVVGGAQINVGAFRITGRYMLGLNDISSSEVNEAWKNRGFQLGIGIKIL
ncbi:MAG: PorT family protein [Bacteroidetes bacterium]|nr:PorT family protein [Bacteroidota bacterium]